MRFLSLIGALAVAGSAFISSAAATEQNLQAVGPPALAGEYPFGISNNGATFGSYGTSSKRIYLNAHVILSTTNSSINACNEINTSGYDFTWPRANEKFFLMLDRSDDCTFVDQIYNAQDAGATAVIVVDNVDEQLPEMKDDGNGKLVTVPAMIISKQDGALIKQSLIDDWLVVLSLKWNIN